MHTSTKMTSSTSTPSTPPSSNPSPPSFSNPSSNHEAAVPGAFPPGNSSTSPTSTPSPPTTSNPSSNHEAAVPGAFPPGSLFAIIVAGGKGLRMGGDLPKQFISIGGRPVLMHTLEAFHRALPGITLVLVLPADHQPFWQDLCARHSFTIPHTIATGGETRFHSVLNGLRTISYLNPQQPPTTQSIQQPSSYLTPQLPPTPRSIQQPSSYLTPQLPPPTIQHSPLTPSSPPQPPTSPTPLPTHECAERFSREEAPPPPALVAIHDGVRPFVSGDVIRRTFAAAYEHGAALPVVPVVETIRELTPQTLPLSASPPPSPSTVTSVTRDRTHFRLVQTPQVFRLDILQEAYQQPFRPTFTDDASVVEAIGQPISLVEGNRENIKLTTPFDLTIADALLNKH